VDAGTGDVRRLICGDEGEACKCREARRHGMHRFFVAMSGKQYDWHKVEAGTRVTDDQICCADRERARVGHVQSCGWFPFAGGGVSSAVLLLC